MLAVVAGSWRIGEEFEVRDNCFSNLQRRNPAPVSDALLGVSRSRTGARFPGPGGKLGKKKETQSLSGKDGQRNECQFAI